MRPDQFDEDVQQSLQVRVACGMCAHACACHVRVSVRVSVRGVCAQTSIANQYLIVPASRVIVSCTTCSANARRLEVRARVRVCPCGACVCVCALACVRARVPHKRGAHTRMCACVGPQDSASDYDPARPRQPKEGVDRHRRRAGAHTHRAQRNADARSVRAQCNTWCTHRHSRAQCPRPLKAHALNARNARAHARALRTRTTCVHCAHAQRARTHARVQARIRTSRRRTYS